MKRLFLAIIGLLFVGISITAQQTSNNTTNTPVGLEVRPIKDKPSSPHRAPVRINIEAFYDFQTHNLAIMHTGETAGEVYLYLDGSMVGYDTEINTSFQITAPGLYKIEIIGENWIAEGYFEV